MTAWGRWAPSRMLPGPGRLVTGIQIVNCQLDYESLPTATYGIDCRLTGVFDVLNRLNGHSFTTPTRPGALSSTYQFHPNNGWLTGIVTPLSATAFTHGYRANSYLVESVTCSALPTSPGGGSFAMGNDYEPDMDRLRSVTTSAGRNMGRYDFQYDQQSRLWKTTRSGEIFQYFGSLTETFGYNDREELTSAASTASPSGAAITLSDRALAFDYDNAHEGVGS